jgi:hypothetical protein
MIDNSEKAPSFYHMYLRIKLMQSKIADLNIGKISENNANLYQNVMDYMEKYV